MSSFMICEEQTRTDNIICIDPCRDPIWHGLIQSGISSVFHTPMWMEALARTYGWHFQGLVLTGPDGTPRAGLPFCRVDDLLGTRVIVLPFSDYCDPIAENQKDWTRMLQMLLAQGVPVSIRCVHSDLPRADPRLTETKRAKWHGLDLRPETNQLWNRFDKAAHGPIRTAERQGVTIRPAKSKEDLRSFYELHLHVRKYKYRILAQPFRFFENLWECFIQDGRGFLLLAYYKEQMIAGTMFLRWKNTLYYKFNASMPEYLATRPNDLIIWESILRAKQEGCSDLDFGLSDWDQKGLIQFKRKFGSAEKTIYFLARADTVGAAERYQMIRGMLSNLSASLVEPGVPDQQTERGGDLLYQLFA